MKRPNADVLFVIRNLMKMKTSAQSVEAMLRSPVMTQKMTLTEPFQEIGERERAYYLGRSDLRDYWKKVIDSMPLEPKGNGNGKAKQEDVDLIAKVVAKVIRELRGNASRGLAPGLGFLMEEEPMETLRKYLESS
ncbi:hypothetical protein MUP37_04550 [Candidatus Bathyarchaeota archaeon]|nr:hypothetical protein [Candidatus Bathyarchaeota archaeon]